MATTLIPVSSLRAVRLICRFCGVNMAMFLKYGGEQNLVTGSTRSPNQKPSTLCVPEMLTPSEIDWLKQNAKDTADEMKKIYRELKSV